MKRYTSLIVAACSLAFPANAQLASKCTSRLSKIRGVACVDRWAAVLPEPFSRFLAEDLADALTDSFRLTSVPADSSFQRVRDATFIVFNETAGLDILGLNPSYEHVLEAFPVTLEAPIYVPSINSIIFSPIATDVYEQQLLNLTDCPPSVRTFSTNPPIYGVNGGQYYNGSLYWAVAAGAPFPNPHNSSETVLQSPGVVRVDPVTAEAEFLLNNYFGAPFNSPDDLVVSRRTGDVFFTDPWFGYGMNLTTIVPPSPPMVYRFRPSTRQTSVVDNTVEQPNGIVFSPDESILYVTELGYADFDEAPADGSLPRFDINRHGARNVYAFDTVPTPAGYQLINRRPIYLPAEYLVDGLRTTALRDPSDRMSFYLVGAAGNGVDVLSPYGELLVRITVTDFTVVNIQFAGVNEEGNNDLWLFGSDGNIGRLTLNLKGMDLE
ncbi:hypothetical protein DL769_007334 [Monosporascus sp. CRB-8-3]|nr:hypothetical protein DL769_007334 [Monosporascus sp. CRB-8-3]